jgi:hypothetical protein
VRIKGKGERERSGQNERHITRGNILDVAVIVILGTDEHFS